MSDRGYLFDTNVVSELRRPRPDPNVLAFHEWLDDEAMFLSVMTIGELLRGAELKMRRDAGEAQALKRWVDVVERSFANHLLDVDRDVADLWGRLSAQRTRPVVDTLIAATAIVHDLTLATRNVADVRDTGVRLVNPWTGEEG